jgi:hypothetical protein
MMPDERPAMVLASEKCPLSHLCIEKNNSLAYVGFPEDAPHIVLYTR